MHIAHPHLHVWDLVPRDAIALQRELAPGLVDAPFTVTPGMLIAGVDVSVKDNRSRAAVVVLRIGTNEVVEAVTAEAPTPYPYVPGLLTFREGPVLLEAFARLKARPDVLMFDGQGRIHPRRMGIAAHMGLWLDLPTLGCGKTPYIGTHGPLAPEAGAVAEIIDKGEVVGAALRTRTNVAPVYISAGHRMDLASALAITRMVASKFRLPEPIRAAHNRAGQGD